MNSTFINVHIIKDAHLDHIGYVLTYLYITLLFFLLYVYLQYLCYIYLFKYCIIILTYARVHIFAKYI
jgi:hypothetical protein